MTAGGRPEILAANVGDLDLNGLLMSPELQAAGMLILALLIGYALSTAVAGALARTSARIHTDLAEHLVALLRRPVWISALLVALELAGDLLRLDPSQQSLYDGALGTLAVIVWTVALVRGLEAVLVTLHRRKDSWLRGRATALVHFAVRIALLLLALYLLMNLWGFDLRAWQVSAGVVGAVLALAAQDSLGNLVAGVIIIADQPLRIGDVIRVDARLRGRVRDIGWRSTRILTSDGIEVNIPNALVSEARIVNESGGPSEAVRIDCEFPVEYGRTPEEIAAIVLPGASSLPEVATESTPELRFLGQTHAGVRFALRVWIADPGRLNEAKDVVNTHVLRALRAAGIGLAYPTQDVGLGGPLAAAVLAWWQPQELGRRS